MASKQCGADSPKVHGVAHGRAGAAIARNRLHDHRHARMVLPQATPLLWDNQPQHTERSQCLEILARKQKLLIALDRIFAQSALAKIYQLALKFLLFWG